MKDKAKPNEELLREIVREEIKQEFERREQQKRISFRDKIIKKEGDK